MLVCTVVTVLVWFMSDLAIYVLDIARVESVLAYLLSANLFMYLLILFLVGPLYVGAFDVALRMVKGESPHAVDAFDFFSSSKKYGRALGLSMALFVRMLPVVLAIRLPWIVEMLSYSFPVLMPFVDISYMVFVPIALAIIFFVCRSFGFISFALLDSEQSIRNAIKSARQARKNNYKTIIALSYETLLKLLLSLLTLGVVTVIETIPMAFLTYGAMAQELKNKLENKPERKDI